MPIFAFILAQGLKILLHRLEWGKWNNERIMGAGGMPSSHSCGVCCLIAIVARTDGVESTTFAMSLIFSLIIMYDAMGVRRAAGRHAQAINTLRRESLPSETSETVPEIRRTKTGKITGAKSEAEVTGGKNDLKELLGHTPLQVLAGASLGIIIGVLVPV